MNSRKNKINSKISWPYKLEPNTHLLLYMDFKLLGKILYSSE